jgi:small subunit ribosomal protein S4
MAKYIGPKTKIARIFGEPIFGPDKALEKKNYPPGQHGNNKRRKKPSVYGIQLKEKQKAKRTYGVLEKQFLNLFKKASGIKGITGEILLQLLESRLDNVVYRMGLAPTRSGARQLVGHRHIIVNNEVCNIPSRQVKPGDIIGIREKSKSMESIQDSLSSASHSAYSWIESDNELSAEKFMNTPERQEIPENIKEQLIFELFFK